MSRLSVALLVATGLLAGTANATDDTPVRSPQVSTIVSGHDGWVGGVTVDQLGYVYVADFTDNIWRWNPLTEKLSLYAGNRYGTSGNTLDTAGNLYQANFNGNTIDRISRSGEISTFVSDGISGPVGMTFDGDGNLYICSCRDHSVKKRATDGTVTQFAKSNHFSCPNGIAMDDNGDFYVVSFSGSTIVKVTPDGETSAFADTGGNGVGHILFLRGQFYVTSYVDNKLYLVSRDGEVKHYAGTGDRRDEDGPALKASFANPNGIAVDHTGSYLYVNDYLGDPNASGLDARPFSIRRIALPRLNAIMQHTLDTETPARARKAWTDYRSDPATAGDETHAEINALGWNYLLQNDIDKATLLFELNAEAHPDSWLALSSLGAAYKRAGRKEEAIEVLERSLELNPDNHRAIQRLEELREG